MKLTIWMASVLLAVPAWPQHARRTADKAQVARTERRIARPAVPRAHAAGSPNSAATPAQAPGVIQTNLLDASNIVWFVNTETLPSGSLISPFVVFPDGSEMPLDSWTLTQDVAPGTSFDLPNIRKFGPFWPEGFMTFGVFIQVNGKDSQASADYPVGFSRNYDDVAMMVPGIVSSAEGITNGDVTLSISGAFTSSRAYVVLDDLVAPRAAIRVSPSEILVNLSAVPGLDLGSMWEYLLTVSQDGWSDTSIFRHVPFKPGSYNPAPK
jgi:hypothetical protein